MRTEEEKRAARRASEGNSSIADRSSAEEEDAQTQAASRGNDLTGKFKLCTTPTQGGAIQVRRNQGFLPRTAAAGYETHA